ncbi:type I restriction-modification system subunit M [Haliea sp.]|uniref:class I SAM-dependent DNA methyltransferase n=1 Tax=Haliea sp. TaxID=1932666 RepID=UPI003527EABA
MGIVLPIPRAPAKVAGHVRQTKNDSTHEGSMSNTEQQFLKELDDKLWKAADKLRANLDAANYKHVVLGLIFLKYVSDAFEERQEALLELFKTDSGDNIYYLPREDYDSEADYQQALQDELEVLDYYREANVFWVPKAARWNTLKEKAVLPVGTVLWQDDAGHEVKLRSVSWLVDNALEEIEKSNARLKGILNRISQFQLENDKLLGLINTFSDTSFTKPVYGGERLSLHSKDVLGHVYEYFLGQFALAEGKQGGQYYTPKSIVTLIVEMLEPYSGRVYDPAMGSGGFFVSSDKFIEEHAKERHYDPAEQRKHISVYGQESNPTTWKLAAMNMAIRGIEFNFGKKNADTFLDDQHPDLRADFVMANPPFNTKDWWSESLAEDARWKYGTPPKGNANFAWMQHMLHHLAPTGSMALLLANGSMSSNTNNEGEIRKRLVEEDLVECMVALPGQLFTNTQIPACIWFLTRDKANGLVRNEKKRDRRQEFLFIDARNLGYMRDRVLRDFAAEDIARIADTFHAWQRHNDQEEIVQKFESESGIKLSKSGQDALGALDNILGGSHYEDVPGFCKSVSLAEIEKHEFVLTPGRYVGTAEQEDDGEPFAEKMARLTGRLQEQFAESERLEVEVRRNLGGLGYGC